MLLLYKNAASMPDFILAMEEAQKNQSAQSYPSLTSNWPCTPPPPFPFFIWRTTRRKPTNGKDKMQR
jgi:hypothetical protein